MSTTALIIGFHYFHSANWTAVTSTSADITAMSEWCKEWADHTIILTDDDLSTLITLRRWFLNFHLSTMHLLIYYTGHGITDHWILPSGEPIHTVEIANLVSDWLRAGSEVVWLLDCCHPTHFYLPFRLTNNVWQLQADSQVYYCNNLWLVIIAAHNTEKSLATKKGSLFTQGWLHYLSEHLHQHINLRQLMGNIASKIYTQLYHHYQTVSIYSSHLIDPVLWIWVGRSVENLVVTDPSLTLLVLPQKIMDELDSNTIDEIFCPSFDDLREALNTVSTIHGHRSIWHLVSTNHQILARQLQEAGHSFLILPGHCTTLIAPTISLINGLAGLVLGLIRPLRPPLSDFQQLSYTEDGIHFYTRHRALLISVVLLPDVGTIIITDIYHLFTDLVDSATQEAMEEMKVTVCMVTAPKLTGALTRVLMLHYRVMDWDAIAPPVSSMELSELLADVSIIVESPTLLLGIITLITYYLPFVTITYLGQKLYLSSTINHTIITVMSGRDLITYYLGKMLHSQYRTVMHSA